MTCWDLSSLYESEQQWQEEAERIVAEANVLNAYADVWTTTAELLLEAFQKKNEIEMKLESLYTYAYLRHLENTLDAKQVALLGKAEAWIDDVYEHLSDFDEHICSIPEESLTRFLYERIELREYAVQISRIRNEEEALDESEAEVIRHIESMMSTPNQLYSSFVIGDLKCTPIPDRDGNLHEVTEGNYLGLLMSKDRELRRSAYVELLGSYGKFGHTLTSILIAHVKVNLLLARQKGVNSVLELTLKEDGVKPQEYDNLIFSVKENVYLLHGLHQFRSEQLGQSHLHWFDLFHSVVPDVSFRISYEQAQELILDALAILGHEYINHVQSAFDRQWIDVWPREGKMPGAFTVGAYLSHPFLSLNFTESLDDICTLAHELGHAVHMMLYQEHQPYVYSDCSTFIKEIAALVNEHLLVEQLIRQTYDEKERAFLLNFSLEQFRGKVFRQTVNAEFERDLYELIQREEATTYEELGGHYTNLLAEYYGPHLVTDDLLRNEWLRIRHFYHSFYLYSYPLGFLIAATIAKQLLDEENNMREKYMLLLKSGSSMQPCQLLRTVGIDLSSPETFRAAFFFMQQRLEELKVLIV